jgi:hypothetical protein
MHFDRKSKILSDSITPSSNPIFGGETIETSIDLYRIEALVNVPYKWTGPTFVPRVRVS